MKKGTIALLLVVLLTLMIPLSANATTPRATAIVPGLSFSGSTATCTLTVSADSSDSIYATIRLWRGSTCLKTWYKSATELLTFRDTVVVSQSNTYTLTADVSINGNAQPQSSVTRSN